MLLTIFNDASPFLEWISTPPGSMFFILIIATITGLISTGLTKWLVDTDEINRKQVALKAHNEEKVKIIEIAEVDPERYRKLRKKWERKDEMFKQTQQKMGLQRLKPACITFLPMIIIFSILRALYYPAGIPYPVALSPMNANDIPLIGGIIASNAGRSWINFTAWYFLCSLGISTLMQRIFKLQTQASGGLEQMMGGTKAKAMEFPDI